MVALDAASLVGFGSLYLRGATLDSPKEDHAVDLSAEKANPARCRLPVSCQDP